MSRKKVTVNNTNFFMSFA